MSAGLLEGGSREKREHGANSDHSADHLRTRARAPLRVLSLFAGIGGFDLGLERTGGFRTVAFCEIEPFPRAVLAKHWPGVPCYDDVRTLTAERLASDGIAVDAIVGGFPCQDISEANVRGAGLDGDRSGLWFQFARLVGELRPLYVGVENTAAILGRGLDRVLGSLAALGYDAEWHSISASAVGAPHDRDRVWIVAYPSKAHGRPLLEARDLARSDRIFAEGKEASGRLALAGSTPWAQPWPAVLHDLGRVDDGLSDGVGGYNAYANAVVPQIPELIGRAILASLAA